MQHGKIGLMTVAVSCLTTGCSIFFKNPTMNNATNIPHVLRQQEMEARMGRVITLDGIAVNAKLSAAVTLDSTIPVYVEDREEWPSSILGAPVQVTGTVVKHAGLHNPLVGGIQDDYYSIRNSTWKASAHER